MQAQTRTVVVALVVAIVVIGLALLVRYAT
jgi:hypothetical protein